MKVKRLYIVFIFVFITRLLKIIWVAKGILFFEYFSKLQQNIFEALKLPICLVKEMYCRLFVRRQVIHKTWYFQ